jgi:thymidylate synthase
VIVIQESHIAKVWEMALFRLMNEGEPVSPRGIKCYEITDAKVVLLNARNNLLVNPVRKLSPRFAVAEWLWIFFGHQDVKTITQYSKRIAQFSDDGISFNGTYGIPVVAQWDHTVNTLLNDPFSRQAVISIFRFTDLLNKHGAIQRWVSKDIPCTISLQFLLRDGTLDCIATMRSSDVWLGLPYDVFNFSMMQNIMAGQLGVKVGHLSLNLGSFHLYESNLEKAKTVFTTENESSYCTMPALPGKPLAWLDDVLSNPVHGDGRADMGTEWSRFAGVLTSKTDEEALAWLRG